MKTAMIIFHSGGQEKKEIYISEKSLGVSGILKR